MATEELIKATLLRAARQRQFLEVIDRDEAEVRFRRHLKLAPLGEETIPLSRALGRVLAQDILANVDVPGFDRSSVDGFAVRAADTAGASDDLPRLLRLNSEILTPGVQPKVAVVEGTATIVATGGMVPRGADAVLMIEYTDVRDEGGELLIEVHRPVAPGEAVAAAGGDIARGETVLRVGQVLTSRKIGGLPPFGLAEIPVWRKPRVAIFSTGDELVAPGQPALCRIGLRFQRRNPGSGGGGVGRRSGSPRHRPRRREETCRPFCTKGWKATWYCSPAELLQGCWRSGLPGG